MSHRCPACLPRAATLVACVFCASPALSEEPPPQWVKTLYGAAAALPERGRGGETLAWDAQGNLLLAGQVHPADDWDAMTLKYDDSGRLLWSWVLDRGSDDIPLALRTDLEGALYWAGYSSQPWGHVPNWLVKQDAEGRFLWERELDGFDGLGLGLEFTARGELAALGTGTAGALRVRAFDRDGAARWDFKDPATEARMHASAAAGETLVMAGRLTGEDVQGGGVRTLALDPDGALAWAHTLSTPGPSRPRGILDLGDGVLVYGETQLHGERDLLAFEIDRGGALRWSRSIDLGGRDFTSDARLAADGARVLAGSVYQPAKRRHTPFTLRLDHSGATLTTALGQSLAVTPPMAATLDRDGLLLGAGEEDGYSIRRLDPSGATAWAVTEPGRSREGIAALEPLPSGDILALATGRGNLSLRRYDAQGALIWEADTGLYTGATEAVGPKGLVADPVDGVHLLGRVVSTWENAVFVAHIDRAGIEQWRQPLPDYIEYPFGLILTANGQLATAAWGAGWDHRWIRLSRQGEILAEGVLDLPKDHFGNALAQGPNGGLCIAGDYSSNGSYGVFVACFDAEGRRRWLTRAGDPAYGHTAFGLATDPAGRLVLGGEACDDGRCRPLLAVFGADGDLIFERVHPPILLDDRVRDLALDPAGAILLTGRSFDGDDHDLFLGKYSSINGDALWAIRHGDPKWQEGVAVTATAEGDVLVTGNRTEGLAEMLTARFSGADGGLQWERLYTGSAGANGLGRAIVTTPDGCRVVGETVQRGFPQGLSVVAYPE